MSDLDRYLTDEAVEKAARALWDEPGWEQATHEQRQHHREAAARALSAVADQLRAEALPVVGHKAEGETDEQRFTQMADRLERGYPVGGSNTRAALAQLIRREVARAAKLREAGR